MELLVCMRITKTNYIRIIFRKKQEVLYDKLYSAFLHSMVHDKSTTSVILDIYGIGTYVVQKKQT